MAQFVYLLCALTSIGCAVLLLRGYFQSKKRLLLWSGMCFALFAVSNILLFVDLVIVPQTDLALYRMLVGFAGLLMLLYGLIWGNLIICCSNS